MRPRVLHTGLKPKRYNAPKARQYGTTTVKSNKDLLPPLLSGELSRRLVPTVPCEHTNCAKILFNSQLFAQFGYLNKLIRSKKKVPVRLLQWVVSHPSMHISSKLYSNIVALILTKQTNLMQPFFANLQSVGVAQRVTKRCVRLMQALIPEKSRVKVTVDMLLASGCVDGSTVWPLVSNFKRRHISELQRLFTAYPEIISQFVSPIAKLVTLRHTVAIANDLDSVHKEEFFKRLCGVLRKSVPDPWNRIITSLLPAQSTTELEFIIYYIYNAKDITEEEKLTNLSNVIESLLQQRQLPTDEFMKYLIKFSRTCSTSGLKKLLSDLWCFVDVETSTRIIEALKELAPDGGTIRKQVPLSVEANQQKQLETALRSLIIDMILAHIPNHISDKRILDQFISVLDHMNYPKGLLYYNIHLWREICSKDSAANSRISKLLKHMEQSGVSPDSHTYSLLLTHKSMPNDLREFIKNVDNLNELTQEAVETLITEKENSSLAELTALISKYPETLGVAVHKLISEDRIDDAMILTDKFPEYYSSIREDELSELIIRRLLKNTPSTNIPPLKELLKDIKLRKKPPHYHIKVVNIFIEVYAYIDPPLALSVRQENRHIALTPTTLVSYITALCTSYSPNKLDSMLTSLKKLLSHKPCPDLSRPFAILAHAIHPDTTALVNVANQIITAYPVFSAFYFWIIKLIHENLVGAAHDMWRNMVQQYPPHTLSQSELAQFCVMTLGLHVRNRYPNVKRVNMLLQRVRTLKGGRWLIDSGIYGYMHNIQVHPDHLNFPDIKQHVDSINQILDQMRPS